MSKCQCYYCRKHRALAKAIRNKDMDDLAKIARELGNRAILAEFDVNYYACILSGKWDSAIEILKHALKNARKVRKNEEKTKKNIIKTS